jgi:hypothetical protein
VNQRSDAAIVGVERLREVPASTGSRYWLISKPRHGRTARKGLPPASGVLVSCPPKLLGGLRARLVPGAFWEGVCEICANRAPRRVV